MKKLPTPEVYEKEFKYMPWGILIRGILNLIQQKTPQQANVLDLMCGPGYLLSKIKEQRPDLKLKGIDIDKEFITYAKEKYKEITFEIADVTQWKTNEKFDLILCTGGLHHLPYEKQEDFIKSIKDLLDKDGFCIIADPYIDDYSNEQERKKSAAKLGYGYLSETIKNNGPQEIISAAIDILYNDIMKFEFKTSINKNQRLFKKYFSFVEINKTWPKSDSEYGDYFFVLKN